MLLVALSAGTASVRAATMEIGWDRLAGFDFAAPAYEPGQDDTDIRAQSVRQIPADIAKLDGQKVVVTGFMLPVRLKEGLVTEFLLVSDPMVCCYGAVPKVNEWITVRLATGIEPLMDVPLAFAGLLRVGPVLDNGYLTTIYEMDEAGQVKR
jgi:hypothetical protein